MLAVMWSNFRLSSTGMICATVLSTFCRGWMWTALSQWRTLLQ